MDVRRTRNPDVHPIVDGRRVQAETVGGVCSFIAPEGTHHVVIASRSVVPNQSDSSSHDTRRLGVPIHGLVLSGTGLRVEIGPSCPLLVNGFYQDEGSHRWTDGRGSVPGKLLRCFASDISIAVGIGETELEYPDDRLGAAHMVESTTSTEPDIGATRTEPDVEVYLAAANRD